MKKRISKIEYYMKFAELAAQRSTCLRRSIGAVLIKDSMIISTGYNGAPKGHPHCIDIGCNRKDVESGTMQELCCAIHAEQNVIIQAAFNGISTINSVLYVTHQPCSVCAKSIVQAGIKEVVYNQSYPDINAEKIFEKSNIKFIQYKEKLNKKEK